MSIYRPKTLVSTYAAYNVYRPTPTEVYEATTNLNDERAAIPLVDGDILINGLSTYTVGTVISYAIKNGHDPIAEYERALENGHEPAYIFANGSCITSHKRAAIDVLQIEDADRVRLEGKTYIVERAPNNNFKLTPA